jgi:hypothetical protein
MLTQNPKGSGLITPATLAATGVGLKLYTDYAVRQAEVQVLPVGQFIAVNGLRVHYVRRGSGQPVVFLHGNDRQLQDFTLSILDRAARATIKRSPSTVPATAIVNGPSTGSRPLKPKRACCTEHCKRWDLSTQSSSGTLGVGPLCSPTRWRTRMPLPVL